MKVIYDVHTHYFNYSDVPNRFFGKFLDDIFKKKLSRKVLLFILDKVLPWKTDKLSRYSVFLSKFEYTDMELFEEYYKTFKTFYPDSILDISVLSMDMSYMGAGNVSRNYFSQLDALLDLFDLIQLKYKDVRFNLILHVDPRNSVLVSNFKELASHYNIRGIKLYPNLGYFVFDEALLDVYKVCEDLGLKVFIHSTKNNPVHLKETEYNLSYLKNYFEYEKSKLSYLDSKYDTNYMDRFFKGKPKFDDYLDCLTNVVNLNYVLEKYELPINICHFGGKDSLLNYYYGFKSYQFNSIVNLCSNYPNVYVDISYSFACKNILFDVIPHVVSKYPFLVDRIMRGSDFYMSEAELSIEEVYEKLKKFESKYPDLFNKFVYINPNKFYHTN